VAGLQGLAKDLQALAIELRQLVEEENAVVRQADLAGGGDASAANLPASLMVWCGSRKGRVARSGSSVLSRPRAL
jgi:hypothetical protein